MYEISFVKEYKTAVGHIQTWGVYPAGQAGQTWFDVELFKHGGKWHAWTGCFVSQQKQQVALQVAETVNALEGNV
jgi:hypothetical protein